ncbi:MAG: hypothetical protein AB7P00_37690 [Sandaracinaceae bacterium]
MRITMTCALLVLGGCGRSHAGPMAGPSVLVALEPRTETGLRVRADGPFVTDPDGMVHVAADPITVTFAEGDGYPSEVRLSLEDVARARCVASTDSGSLVSIHVEELSGSGEGVSVALDGETLVTRADPGAADATFHVVAVVSDATSLGSCGVDVEEGAPARVDFDLIVATRSVEGVSVRWPVVCDDAAVRRWFTDTNLDGISYRPVGPDGEDFVPINATERSVDLWLRTVDGSSLRVGDEGDLASVRLPDRATTVELSTERGDPVTLEVVEVGRLEQVDVRLSLTYPTDELVDGSVVDGAARVRLNRANLRVVGPFTIDEAPTCGAPSLDAFRVSTATPEVCAVSTTDHSWTPTRDVLAQIALQRDGACSVRWTAPDFAEGAGLEGSVTFDLVNADLLEAP